MDRSMGKRSSTPIAGMRWSWNLCEIQRSGFPSTNSRCSSSSRKRRKVGLRQRSRLRKTILNSTGPSSELARRLHCDDRLFANWSLRPTMTSFQLELLLGAPCCANRRQVGRDAHDNDLRARSKKHCSPQVTRVLNSCLKHSEWFLLGDEPTGTASEN